MKLDRIGDWILATPFLESLRRNAAAARITAVMRRAIFDLAVTCPFIDRAIGIDSFWDGIGACRATDAAEAAAFRRDFALGAFDLAIVPRWDADFDGAIRLAAASGAARIIGFSETATPRKRLVNRGANRFLTDVVDRCSVTHEVLQNLSLIEAIGGRIVTRAPSLRLTATDEQAAERFVKALRPPLLAVAPFACNANRMLPLPRLAAILRPLMNRFGFAPVILGSAENHSAGDALAALLGGGARSLCQRMSLRQTAAVIARTALLIGMDSGPAHIAAALGTPVAVIACHPRSGSAAHENSPCRFAPWGPPSRVLVLQPEEAKMPCRDGCAASFPHCILGLAPDAMIASLEAFTAGLPSLTRPNRLSISL